jgi:tRNA(Ile)-lysidine synthase
VAFRHVAAALELSRSVGGGPGSSSFDGPGQRLERIGHSLVLTTRQGSRASAGVPVSNLFRYPLSIPGEVRLPEAGCVVSAEAGQARATVRPGAPGRNEAVIRMDRVNGPLAVRNRRPGDRFRPAGLAGRKKLQDYFVDKKVARAERDGVPLVVDESDRILWVAGYAVDEEFWVTDPAQPMLILRLKLLGGSA